MADNLGPLEQPLAWLLTFSTYGTWLHGDPRGSVDLAHNAPGTPCLRVNPWLEARRRSELAAQPFVLDQRARAVVSAAIEEHVRAKAWSLFALNVRSTHAHATCAGGPSPERMMLEFKAYSTRALASSGAVQAGRRVWTRHGSTRPLWNLSALAAACEYVVERQGEPLGRYVDPIAL